VPSDKRERKRSKQERDLAYRAAMTKRKQRRSRLFTFAAMVVAAGISLLGVLSFTGRQSPEAAARARSTTTTEASLDAPCPKADGSSPRRNAFRRPPRFCIRPDGTYQARFLTDTGTFVLDLDVARAPETVNNFVFLARYHFFDGVPFHRVKPGDYIQGGNPPQQGVTGPGYVFADENVPVPPAHYKVGQILMAREKPNSNGSQFVIITGPEGEGLPLVFPTFGEVSEGLDVVMRIDADGAPDFTPKVLHTIREVKIIES
jgi:cyclophilin family peptidyl-prolyl cis-trans isomerase